MEELTTSKFNTYIFQFRDPFNRTSLALQQDLLKIGRKFFSTPGRVNGVGDYWGTSLASSWVHRELLMASTWGDPRFFAVEYESPLCQVCNEGYWKLPASAHLVHPVALPRPPCNCLSRCEGSIVERDAIVRTWQLLVLSAVATT